MATAPPSARKITTVLARVPYLNCAPFFQGLALEESWAWKDVPPRQLGLEAERGDVTAGPMAVADFLRLQDRFERLGHLGIAVRGRTGSALLFSRLPIRQLDGAILAVTDESSTTALLLRLILEQRYRLVPKTYLRGQPTEEADAVLLIGDEALKFRVTNRRYPYEMDVAFEWWLWQHLPCVFAVWAIRKGCDPDAKQTLSRALFKALAANTARLESLANERAGQLGIPAEELKAYLENFLYRLGDQEERAIARFAQLAHDHRLL